MSLQFSTEHTISKKNMALALGGTLQRTVKSAELGNDTAQIDM